MDPVHRFLRSTTGRWLMGVLFSVFLIVAIVKIVQFTHKV